MNAPATNAPRSVRLSPQDNVLVAVDNFEPGAVLYGVTAKTRVWPFGAMRIRVFSTRSTHSTGGATPSAGR